MIGACRDLTDYRRANEWIEATERYCDRQSLEAFPGVCRIHRAEVAAVDGAWDRAESDVGAGDARAPGLQRQPAQADGYYILGDIRRRRGDLAGAEDALREAHALGRTPQPALALVRLAQGHDGRSRSGHRRRGRRRDVRSLGPRPPPGGPGRDRLAAVDRRGPGRRRRARRDRRHLPVAGAVRPRRTSRAAGWLSPTAT